MVACVCTGRKIVSSDSHIVKMWDQQTGANFTNIEPPEGGLNDICLWKDSGLVMLACDAPKIQVFVRDRTSDYTGHCLWSILVAE